MNNHQQKVLEAALSYQAQGLSVIPLRPRDKRPLIKWEQYQKERATPQQIQEWVREWPELNLGIVTGSVSGIAVVDIEKDGSISGYEPTTTVQTGGGGYHLYYSLPDGTEVGNGVRVRELTDYRGEGGYVVAPPSIHESGNEYQWVEPLSSPADLPPFPIELLGSLAPTESKKDWREIPAQHVSEGSRNQEFARVIGGMLKRLKKNEFESLGWPIAQGVNQTFVPPLPLSELRASYESIVASESRGRVHEEGESDEPYTPATLAELYSREFPPVEWAVKDLVPLGGMTGISGEANGFKSFIAQDMAACIVSGQPFLGHFPTIQGKVLIVDEENNPRLIRDRFRTLGLEPSENLLILSQVGFRADMESSLRRMRAVVEREKPTLIILDSLIDIHGKNENDAPEMNAIFLAIRRELLSEESAIIVLHHHRKLQAGQRSRPGQSMRGSSSIYGSLDALITVDRKSATDVVMAQDKLRVQEQMGSFKASLVATPEGRTVFAFQGEDTTRQEALLEVQDAILEALSEASEPMSLKMLEVATSYPVDRLRGGVNALVADGEVTRAPNGKSGTHRFMLPNPSEPSSEEDSSSPSDIYSEKQKLAGE